MLLHQPALLMLMSSLALAGASWLCLGDTDVPYPALRQTSELHVLSKSNTVTQLIKPAGRGLSWLSVEGQEGAQSKETSIFQCWARLGSQDALWTESPRADFSLHSPQLVLLPWAYSFPQDCPPR